MKKKRKIYNNKTKIKIESAPIEVTSSAPAPLPLPCGEALWEYEHNAVIPITTASTIVPPPPQGWSEYMIRNIFIQYSTNDGRDRSKSKIEQNQRHIINGIWTRETIVQLKPEQN